MEKKYIKVTLREPITAVVAVDIDFESDPLKAHAYVERTKQNLAHEIKRNLFERVTTLHIDDLDFKFVTE